MAEQLDNEEAILLTGQLLGIGVAGVAVAATQDPYVAGLAAFLPTLGALATKSMARRLENMWAGFTQSAGDEDAARARLNAAADIPDVQDAVFETFKSVREALDPEVVFAIGRLLWPYTSGDRKPDRFFRNMGRMLVDLDLAELKELANILRPAASEARRRDMGILSLVAAEQDSTNNRGVVFVEDYGLKYRNLLYETGTAQHSFAILKRNGFGFDENRWGLDPSASIKISSDDVEGIVRVIDL